MEGVFTHPHGASSALRNPGSASCRARDLHDPDLDHDLDLDPDLDHDLDPDPDHDPDLDLDLDHDLDHDSDLDPDPDHDLDHDPDQYNVLQFANVVIM